MAKKHKTRSLHQQKHKVLQEILRPGTSKHQDKLDGFYKNFIYSYSTYHTYSYHSEDFIRYIKSSHPEIKLLEDARSFVPEYLKGLENWGIYSPYTIHLKAKALGKLYNIHPGDPDYYTPPERHREDIRRSRPGNAEHKNFSEKNNAELIHFVEGTGFRRHELAVTRPEDLYTREEIYTELKKLNDMPAGTMSKADHKKLSAFKNIDCFTNGKEYFVYIPCGKGGKSRIAPVIGDHVDEIVARYRSTPAETKVWPHIHSGADVHGFRAHYAAKVYRAYARPIEDIPYDKLNRGSEYYYQSDVYVARKDMSGIKFDRKAMAIVSKALGHNRVSIVASSYLWALNI